MNSTQNFILTALLSSSLMIVPVVLFAIDIRAHHEPGTRHRFILRLAVCAVTVLLALLHTMLYGWNSYPLLALDIEISLLLLLSIPLHYEDMKTSRIAMSAITGAGIIVPLAVRLLYSNGNTVSDDAMRGLMICLSVFVVLLNVGYLGWRCYKRFATLNTIFRPSAPMDHVADNFRYLVALVAIVLLIPAVLCVRTPWLCLLCLPGLAVLFYLYVRSIRERTFFLGIEKEKKIDDLVKGVVSSAYSESLKSDERLKDLYERIVRYMDSKKPYLDEDFKVKDLSMYVFSNKSLVSRAINDVGHYSFPRFVNKYRVEDAKQLLMKDPKLKMVQVSMMVGFHSVTTFNVSFKEFTGYTPTIWLQQYHLQKQEHPEDGE